MDCHVQPPDWRVVGADRALAGVFSVVGHKAGRLVGWVFVKGGGGVGWARSPLPPASSGQRRPVSADRSALSGCGVVRQRGFPSTGRSWSIIRLPGSIIRLPQTCRVCCGGCGVAFAAGAFTATPAISGVVSTWVSGKIPPGREPDPGRSRGAGSGGLGGAGSVVSRYVEGSYRIVGTRRRLPPGSTMGQGSDDNKSGYSTPLI